MALLLTIWQLPQMLLGWLFRLLFKRKAVAVVEDRGVMYYVVPRFPGGISLGNTVIIWGGWLQDEKGWNHEYGHTLQSKYLGPLYLIVIGLPSLLWAWIHTPQSRISYYDFYTEKWADKLGGVMR